MFRRIKLVEKEEVVVNEFPETLKIAAMEGKY